MNSFSAIITFWWDDYDKVRFKLDFYSASIYWNTSQRVDMLCHLDTVSWLQAKQFLLSLLNDACIAETQQI